MKTPILQRVLLALAVVLCTACYSVAADAEPPTDFLKAKAEVVEAWQDMRFGMFNRWGRSA